MKIRKPVRFTTNLFNNNNKISPSPRNCISDGSAESRRDIKPLVPITGHSINPAPMRQNVRSNINGSTPELFQVEYWDITRPIPYANNPRIMTEEAIQGVMKSLERFGQQRPLVADIDTNEVVVGHTMLEAIKRLGWDGVWTKPMRGTPEEIKAYRIADNKLATFNRDDIELMQRELAHLEHVGFNIDVTGFSRDALVTDNWEMDSAREEVDKVKGEMVPLKPKAKDFTDEYATEFGALVVRMVLPGWSRGHTEIEDRFMDWIRESEEYWRTEWAGFRMAYKET